MKMQIDKKNMLFVNIDTMHHQEMMAFCEDIVVHGKVPHPLPDWCQEWMDCFGFDDRQRLLVISTAFVQKVMWSLLNEPRNFMPTA